MNVADWLSALHQEVQRRAYIDALVVLDQSASLLKARLLIAADLFVQVYRNDRFDTTNLVLMTTNSASTHGTNWTAYGIATPPPIRKLTIPAPKGVVQ